MPDTEDTIEVSSGDLTPDGAESAPETGAQIIARYVKHLGTGPGVYRMMDKAGEVIYVGKAREPEEPRPELHTARRPHKSHRGDDPLDGVDGVHEYRD